MDKKVKKADASGKTANKPALSPAGRVGEGLPLSWRGSSVEMERFFFLQLIVISLVFSYTFS